MLLMVVISFFTPKASEQQLQGLTYFSQSSEQRKETRNSWSTLDVIASLIVIAACVVFYIYFW
jgi:SSS family solute:Na+ symporter